MNIVFRVDASVIIGSGHLMRCLVLADFFKRRGAEIHFISRDLPETYQTLITQRGNRLHLLSTSNKTEFIDDPQGPPHAHWLGVNWQVDANEVLAVIKTLNKIEMLVIDHYGLDARWEEIFRNEVRKIFVIDDLADRPHNCDVLLDQNFYLNSTTRYHDYIQSYTECLLGPQYALLRPEFTLARQKYPRSERPLKAVQRINICFGGIDAKGDTLKTLAALEPWLKKSLQIDVVLGAASPIQEAVLNFIKSYPTVQLHISPNHLSELLALADLGIGAAGGMTWERACVGLPSITMAVAENQWKLATDVARAGMHLFLGNSTKVEKQELASAIELMLANKYLRQSFADNSLRLTDGKGAERVTQNVLISSIELREASINDCENIFKWRNDAVNRRYSHDTREITYAEHQSWFEKVLENENRFILIGSDKQGPLGVLRFDWLENYWVTSIYLVPNRHGEGLGASLLVRGLEWLQTRSQGRHKVKAEIQPENMASHIVFQRAGFKKQFSTFVTEIQE